MNINDFILAGKLAGSGGGGGNPNSVQVITGTLDNPFGSISVTELSNAIVNGNASALIDIDGTALGTPHYQYFITPFNFVVPNSVVWCGGAYNFSGTITGIQVNWIENENTTELYVADAILEGNYINLISQAASIPTTLTIYWHPMPEGE